LNLHGYPKMSPIRCSFSFSLSWGSDVEFTRGLREDYYEDYCKHLFRSKWQPDGKGIRFGGSHRSPLPAGMSARARFLSSEDSRTKFWYSTLFPGPALGLGLGFGLGFGLGLGLGL